MKPLVLIIIVYIFCAIACKTTEESMDQGSGLKTDPNLVAGEWNGGRGRAENRNITHQDILHFDKRTQNIPEDVHIATCKSMCNQIPDCRGFNFSHVQVCEFVKGQLNDPFKSNTNGEYYRNYRHFLRTSEVQPLPLSDLVKKNFAEFRKANVKVLGGSLGFVHRNGSVSQEVFKNVCILACDAIEDCTVILGYNNRCEFRKSNSASFQSIEVGGEGIDTHDHITFIQKVYNP